MMNLRKIPKGRQPFYPMFHGSEYGEKLVEPLFEHMFGELGYQPEWCHGTLLDSAQVPTLPADLQRLVDTPHFNADLKARVQLPEKHRLIAETLKGVPPNVLESDLSAGSKKIISFTTAIYQVRWPAIRAAIYSKLRSHQQMKTSGGGLDVVTIGGAFGGVGGIAQILSAAAIRTIIRNDSGLRDNLSITGIFVMPESGELDQSRISANTAATFELLQLGQRGGFSLPVPGEEPYNRLGGDEPLFDHVFAVSESSMAGAIPGHDAFRKVLARFMWTWVGPIGEDIRTQLVDPRYRIEEVTL